MVAWLNVGSLILGLIAWIVPVINIMLSRRKKDWHWGTLASMSLSACAVAIWFQKAYTNHLVHIEDYSALLDTTQASTSVSGVLLFVTLLLNLLAYVVYRKKAK